MRRALPFAALFLLAACGQKGPLYLPDAGTAVPASTDAAPASTPAPTPAPGPGSDAATTPTAPITPASPDRSEEGRKRVPATPTPAQSK
jgi:predicted small lipoprotein YifL